jgi:NitT/TauT family transport system ATP-binding protein
MSDVPQIKLEQVDVRYRTREGWLSALEGITLDIAPRSFVSVVGPSGCGKTTLLKIVSGILPPSGGRVFLDGRPLDAVKLEGQFGFVFQRPLLLPWRTALDNVLLGFDILGVERGRSRPMAMDWLAKLGLAGHEKDYPHALSGGMRQRVSIARALAVDPTLILCDEPFSALDEMTARRLRAEFLRLVRESAKTALFVTHSIDEALEVGDRIVVLRRPARIALEAGLCEPLSAERKAELRERILEVLGEEGDAVAAP